MLWQDGTFVYYHSDPNDKRRVGETMGQRQELERKRKKDAILDLIASEALEGRVYTASQFALRFEDALKLGSETTIRRRIKAYACKGWIKFFDNHKDYGLPAPATRQGYICVRDMLFTTDKVRENPDTGQEEYITKTILPTHYKHSGSSTMERVENPNIWLEEEYSSNDE
jgi:hypothetical protein